MESIDVRKIKALFREFLPEGYRARRSLARTEKYFKSAIREARARADKKRVLALESERAHELSLLGEEQDDILTRDLLLQARKLNLPVPVRIDSSGADTDKWYEGTQTGGLYLTRSGMKELREEIRRENKARHEARTYWLIWVSSCTGVIGTITGLVAVLKK